MRAVATITHGGESALVASLLGADGSGARALLIHGEAGIGKTTHWRAALREAGERGYRVVSAVSTEAEMHLPFAGLTDLLGDLATEHAGDLPPPQRVALDVALMRADADAAPVQPLALSLAVLELLRRSSARHGLVIGIDDVQWLDASTAAALRFALRRLDREPVVVVATERTLEPESVPAVLADLSPQRIVRLAVPLLERDQVDRLLDDALGLQLAPTALDRLYRCSGGNPMHAIELGRALHARGGRWAEGDDLLLPDSLAGLVRARLTALSADALAVVVHAAALAKPDISQLERALGPKRARSGIRDARSAGVIAPDDDPLRFTHPLLEGEAYGALDESERREVHGRLAPVVADIEEQARHRALAATGPDARVARTLDTAAEHARARGAPEAAAMLCDLAARLTPAGSRAWAHRVAEGARHLVVAGELVHARERLEAALRDEGLKPGAGRAELQYRLATARQLAGDFQAARDIALTALDEVGAERDEAPLAVEIRLLLAGIAYITGENWADGARHVRAAMRIADRHGARLQALAIGPYASWRYLTGRGYDAGLARRATELERWTRGYRALDLPEFDLAGMAYGEGRTAEAAALIRELIERAEREGDYSSLPFLLAMDALDKFAGGHPAEARDAISRAARLARTTDQQTALVHTVVNSARLDARLGNADGALRAGREAEGLMDVTRWRGGEWAMRADLAVLELSRGDASAALAHVESVLDLPAPEEHPRPLFAAPVAVEALIGLGRLDEAGAILDGLAERMERLPRRVHIEALRTRAQHLAATGDVDAASAAIGEVEREHRAMEDRWDLARTLLVAGDIHRRSRRRAQARAAFREALQLFTLMGASRWARQARERLGRTGMGRREGGLTPAQRGVAELVASGLTNRQVADRLSMSHHTVEAHLSEVYRSLGIRSRRELGPLLASGAAIRDTGAPIRDTTGS